MSERMRLPAAGIAALLLAATAAPVAAQEAPELDLRYGVLVALTGDAGVAGQVWNHATASAVDYVAATVEDELLFQFHQRLARGLRGQPGQPDCRHRSGQEAG